ncbi:putative diacylglycerol kinase catalytic domain-containing protein [Mycobacterium xenopi 3993]|nr:putative diacylglycerol kinase catalytic domain-containing protein [Mycobacterium xenopi 3993]
MAARSLGISPDPIIATNQLIGLLDEYGHQHNWRRIGVIDCGERWPCSTPVWASTPRWWPLSRPSARRGSRSHRCGIGAWRCPPQWPTPAVSPP